MNKKSKAFLYYDVNTPSRMEMLESNFCFVKNRHFSKEKEFPFSSRFSNKTFTSISPREMTMVYLLKPGSI